MLIFGIAWRSPSCPRRCRPWSPSRWRSARSGWSSATRCPPPARGRDAGQHLRHLLGQDRHADQGRDDRRARSSSPGELLEVSGAGYEPRGRVLARRLAGRAVASRSSRLLRAAALASDARIVHDEADGQWQVKGDPTEGALVVAAAKAGLDKRELDAQFPRVDEIPFTSETKRMTTLHETPRGRGRLCQGRAGGDPRVVHAAAVGRRARRRSTTTRRRGAPGRGAADGGRGAARAGGRPPSATPRSRPPSAR